MTAHHHKRPGDGFNGASPRTGGKSDDLWDYWFNLQQAALRSDWKSVDRQLRDGARHKLSHHLFTAQLFTAAAAAGRRDIVEEMFHRGFRLPPEEGRAAVERLVKSGGDEAIPIIAFLARNGYADPRPAIYHIAAEGTTVQMSDLKAGGCDIQSGGDSFSIAFYAGNISMMRYLYHNGADLYRPSMVAGLHGRLASYRRENDGGASEQETLAAYRVMIKDDAQSLVMYYAYQCPVKRDPTLHDFRQVPGGCTEKDWTLMHLAARSGQVADILSAARLEKDRPLMAADFLRVDANGTSVLSILAARGEERLLFDHALWRHDAGEAIKLNAALKELQATEVIDPQRFAAEVRRKHLAEMARSGRWSLHPEKKTGKDQGKSGHKSH